MLRDELRELSKILANGQPCPPKWECRNIGGETQDDDCDECVVDHILAAVEASGEYVRLAEGVEPPPFPDGLAITEGGRGFSTSSYTHHRILIEKDRKSMLTPRLVTSYG